MGFLIAASVASLMGMTEEEATIPVLLGPGAELALAFPPRGCAPESSLLPSDEQKRRSVARRPAA